MTDADVRIGIDIMCSALDRVVPVPVINSGIGRATKLLTGPGARFRIGEQYREQLEALGAFQPGESGEGRTFATLRFVPKGSDRGDWIKRSGVAGMPYYGNISMLLAPDALRGASLLPTMSISADQARSFAEHGMRAMPDAQLAEAMLGRLAIDHKFLSLQDASSEPARQELLATLRGDRSKAIDHVTKWLTDPARVDRGYAMEVILRDATPTSIDGLAIERSALPDDVAGARQAATAAGVELIDLTEAGAPG